MSASSAGRLKVLWDKRVMVERDWEGKRQRRQVGWVWMVGGGLQVARDVLMPKGNTTGHAMQGHRTPQHALPTKRATDSAVAAPVELESEEARGAAGQALSTKPVGGGQEPEEGAGGPGERWAAGSGGAGAATAMQQNPAGSTETERRQADPAAGRISKRRRTSQLAGTNGCHAV